LRNEPICVRCEDQNCKSCPEEKCKICLPGYTFNNQGVCEFVKGPKNCQTWNLSNKRVCVSCEAGFYKNVERKTRRKNLVVNCESCEGVCKYCPNSQECWDSKVDNSIMAEFKKTILTKL
jgi:hypothetical protein